MIDDYQELLRILKRLDTVIQTQFPAYTPVSYTHLDVYKRQVKRCVNDCNLVLHLVNGLLVHNLGLYLGNVLIVDFFANDFVFACCQCRGLVRGLNCGQILYGQYLVGNALVMGRGELGAVLPVYQMCIRDRP